MFGRIVLCVFFVYYLQKMYRRGGGVESVGL